jgi:hypothetical protein
LGIVGREEMIEQKWILDGLPEQKVSRFVKYKGTEKWNERFMYEKSSDDVLCTIAAGSYRTITIGRLIDDRWFVDNSAGCTSDYVVVAWMNLPECYEGKSRQLKDLIVKHKHYVARLYGKSSMAICDEYGREILHTNNRNCNTKEEVLKVLKSFDGAIESLLKM